MRRGEFGVAYEALHSGRGERLVAVCKRPTCTVGGAFVRDELEQYLCLWIVMSGLRVARV